MDYVIKNHKGVYIRLNRHGAPVTCAEHEKTLFEQSKAKNILDSLPKTLRKLKFYVEAIPDITPKEKADSKVESRVIESKNYIISDQIKRWIEKFGICDDILKEAQKRKEELNKALSETDKEFINIIHEIEFEGKIDLYGGWQERNKVKENRERRRRIKDELLVISSVLRMDLRNLDRNTVGKVVASLAKRKFTFRVVDEEEETECGVENVML